MSIEKQIFTYLLKTGKVCLEGIGGFICEEIPAHFNADTQTFIPSTFKVYFSENLKCNNTEFLFFLSELNSISFQEAKKLIDSFIIAVRNSLKEYKKVSLDIIGTLSQVGEHIEYMPSEFVKEIERFGFEELPVYSGQLKQRRLKISHPVKNTTARKYIAAASLIISLLLMPTKPHNTNEASLADSFNLHNRVYTDNLQPSQKQMLNGIEKTFNIKNALYPEIKKEKTEQEATQPTKTTVEKDTIKQVIPQTTLQTTVKKEPTQQKQAKSSHNKKYYGIVLGAFSNRDNAYKFKAQHDDDTLDLQIKYVKGLYRVIAGRFESKKDALNFRKQLSSKGLNGWLTKI